MKKLLVITSLFTFLFGTAWFFPVYAYRAVDRSHPVLADLPSETKILTPEHLDNFPHLQRASEEINLGSFGSQTQIEQAVMTYLQSSPEVLNGLSYESFKYLETRVHTFTHQKLIFMDFIQIYNEMNVEYSLVRATVSQFPNGQTKLYLYVQIFPNISEKMSEGLLASDGVTFANALEAVGLGPEESTDHIREYVIVPTIEGNLETRTKVTFSDKPEFTVVVSPEGLVGVELNIHFQNVPPGPPAIDGAIMGRGYKLLQGGPQPLDNLGLSNLDFTFGSTQLTTGMGGSFIFPAGQTSGTVTGRLLGPYTDVQNKGTLNNLSFNKFVNADNPIAIINPTTSGEEEIAQVNAFHHANYMHDWLLQRADIPSINQQVLMDVNIPSGACDATYGNGILSFFKSGFVPGIGACENAAFDMVIYHEHAHFVDDKIGGITGGGLGEGWGDLLASYISGRAKGPTIFGRSSDNTYFYPSDHIDEIHRLGMAWSGFGWEFRENMIAKYGNSALAEQLILAPLIGNYGSISGSVFAVFLADDDDQNLSNGTPNDAEIIAAASKKHLHPLINSTNTKINSPIRNALLNSSTTPQITVTGTSNDPNMVNYQLFIGFGYDPTSWTPIGPVQLTPVQNGTLGTLDISSLTSGTYMLRLLVDTGVPILKQQYLTPVHINIPWNTLYVSTNDSYSPDSDGVHVVWTEKSITAPENVLLKNIATSAVTNINTVTSTPYVEGKLEGDLVVLTQSSGAIDLYEISTGNVTNLCQVNCREKDLSGTRVAWVEFSSSTFTDVIIVYDHAIGSVTSLPSFGGIMPLKLSISGSLIAFEGRVQSPAGVDLEIFVVDLNNPTSATNITNNPNIQQNPKIDGTVVVYEDERDGGKTNREIYAFDLIASQETRITNSLETSRYVDISNGKIVWTEIDAPGAKSAGSADIWSHDLSLSQSSHLTSSVGKFDLNPSIHNGYVVWESTIGGGTPTQSMYEPKNIMGVSIP